MATYNAQFIQSVLFDGVNYSTRGAEGANSETTIGTDNKSDSSFSLGEELTVTAYYPAGSSTIGPATYDGHYKDGYIISIPNFDYEFMPGEAPFNYYYISNTPLAPFESFARDSSDFVVCYTTGTLIRTVSGEVAVEDLTVGDLVVTASGEHRPIRWIGTQTLDCRNHAKPGAVLPIRIAKDALGPNRPARDLRVSPRHGLCLDLDGFGEVLVPADKLTNDATITQERVDTITYWHVELDSHDLLFAEGVAAESYLDLGNRGFFTGAPIGPDEEVAGAAVTRADCCRPFVEGGEPVALARQQLRERAQAIGWNVKPDPAAGLHLVVDGLTVEPSIDGTVVRFLLPADCGDVRLVSQTTVPALVTGSEDSRRLGVALRRLTVDDGLTVRREIALDDSRLGLGLHPVQGKDGGRHRWTRGDALLPSSLWAGCRDTFFLRLELGGEGLLRWHAPDAAATASDEAATPATAPRLRLVKAA